MAGFHQHCYILIRFEELLRVPSRLSHVSTNIFQFFHIHASFYSAIFSIEDLFCFKEL